MKRLLLFSLALALCLTTVFSSTAAANTAPTIDRALAVESADPLACDPADQVQPITRGYGKPGPYAVAERQIDNPNYFVDITIYYPDEPSLEPVPVVFFAHGYFGIFASVYEAFMRNMASQGVAVVFVPYDFSPFTNITEKYNTMWEGFVVAADTAGPRFDLTRVGFVGHSFGAGALPWLGWKAYVEAGWGTNGGFVFSLAPYYSFLVSQAQIDQFPDQVAWVMQVYEVDDVNDHRMAIDIYNSLPTPSSQKDYHVLYTDSYNGCTQAADHGVPTTGDVLNGLDYYGTYRIAHALIAYTFNGDARGQQVALGQGSLPQRFMGFWGNGGPLVRPLESQFDDPQPLFPPSFYSNPFNSSINPRY